MHSILKKTYVAFQSSISNMNSSEDPLANDIHVASDKAYLNCYINLNEIEPYFSSYHISKKFNSYISSLYSKNFENSFALAKNKIARKLLAEKKICFPQSKVIDAPVLHEMEEVLDKKFLCNLESLLNTKKTYELEESLKKLTDNEDMFDSFFETMDELYHDFLAIDLFTVRIEEKRSSVSLNLLETDTEKVCLFTSNSFDTCIDELFDTMKKWNLFVETGKYAINSYIQKNETPQPILL